MHTYRGREVEDWFDDSDSDDHADDNTGDDGHHEQGPRDSDLDLDDEDRAFMSQFPDTWGRNRHPRNTMGEAGYHT